MTDKNEIRSKEGTLTLRYKLQSIFSVHLNEHLT